MASLTASVLPSSVRSSSSPSIPITSAPSASATASSTNSSSSQPPQVYTVKVGAGGFKYDPEELKDVNAGDTVTFEFYPKDHSVARADFNNACVPYENLGPGRTGFYSETRWVDDVNSLQYWNLTINSTEPIFYYCTAPESCTGHQMVGVINPTVDKTLDKQKLSAKDSSYQLAPGDPTPGEGRSSSAGAAAPTSSGQSSNGGGSHHTLSGGAIAGIVVGAVAFLAICAALFFYVGRAKSLKEVIKHKDATATTPAPPADPYGHPGHPQSPGFPPGPFSPNMGHAEYGGQLPEYGQHNATDAHPSSWGSPPPQMAEVKSGFHAPVELASPTPGQQSFTAELEAPAKTPR